MSFRLIGQPHQGQLKKKEKAEKEEKDKEEKEKKEKQEEEKDKKYREDRGTFSQILSKIAQNQNDTNQTVPQSIISRGTSAVNISTITSTSNSSQQIIVSPRSFNRTPRRQQHQDKVATNITAKQTTKKRKTNENRDDSDHVDCSKYTATETATTIGTESQTEQPIYDLGNGDDSKQHHDVQNGPEGPQLH